MIARLLSSVPLDRLQDDHAGLFLALLGGGILVTLDDLAGLDLRIILDHVQQHLPGLVDAKPGDLQQALLLFF